MRVKKGEAPLLVLEFIAVHGPVSKYGIHKGLNLNYATVFYAVNELLSRQLIQVVEKTSARKNKVSVSKYDITALGGLVAFLLLSEERDTEGLRRLVRKLSTLIPTPIFRKWDYFVKEGMEDLAIEAINDAIFRIILLQVSVMRMPKENETRARLQLLEISLGKKIPFIEEFIHHLNEIKKAAEIELQHALMNDITTNFIKLTISQAFTYDNPNYKRLCEVMLKDPELKQLMKRVINAEINSYRNYIKFLDNIAEKYLK